MCTGLCTLTGSNAGRGRHEKAPRVGHRKPGPIKALDRYADETLRVCAAGQMKTVKRLQGMANPSINTWSVLLEWTGNKSQVLPLIEHIVKRDSDGSGCFLACSLCDAQWDDLRRGPARRIFGAVSKLLVRRIRFAPYVRVSLFNNKRIVEKIARGRAPKMNTGRAA
jgi:hypothetical protein